MDTSMPVRSVIPSLDGPVLMALARTTRPMSGRQLASLAGGSQRGVALVLTRLAHHGLVLAEHYGRTTLYTGNRDHVAWPVIEALAALRGAVVDKIRRSLAGWRVPPVSALIFGSFARGDGDEDSDIDILLVRPLGVAEDERVWDEQKSELRQYVQCLTGNVCQLMDIDDERIVRHVAIQDPIVDNWRHDGIHVAGRSFDVILRDAGSRVGAGCESSSRWTHERVHPSGRCCTSSQGAGVHDRR